MRKRKHRLVTYGIWVLILVGMIGGVGVVAYLSGQLGSQTSHVQPTVVLSSATLAPLGETPPTPYDPLDPAIVESLGTDNITGFDNRTISRVRPVGIYLPRSGSAQFTPFDPTPVPTPLPFPTLDALPLPPLEPLPTLESAVEVEDDGTLAYGGAGCAPSGNPVDGILTQRFHRYHGGIDIGVPVGTPVLATHSGTVVFADWSAIGYGYLVIVENGTFITYYAHNTSFNVQAGDTVGKGSIIARSGSTGNSSGPHVHYETRVDDIPVNPLTFDSLGYTSC